MLSEAIAHELHLHIGESFTLPSPYPTAFRLAGLSTNAGWPPGAIVINAEDYAHAWGSDAASALNIDLAPGVALAEGRTQVIRALGPRSGLAVQTAGERESQWKSVSREGLSRLTQIATLVLIAAILAMAGVMTSLIWQRRERIAYIKRQGFTRGTALARPLLRERGAAPRRLLDRRGVRRLRPAAAVTRTDHGHRLPIGDRCRPSHRTYERCCGQRRGACHRGRARLSRGSRARDDGQARLAAPGIRRPYRPGRCAPWLARRSASCGGA